MWYGWWRHASESNEIRVFYRNLNWKISFSSIDIQINPFKGCVAAPDKVKKYDFEEVEKEKNQDNQEEESKEGGNQELPSEKTVFKKRLVEIEWL